MILVKFNLINENGNTKIKITTDIEKYTEKYGTNIKKQ